MKNKKGKKTVIKIMEVFCTTSLYLSRPPADQNTVGVVRMKIMCSLTHHVKKSNFLNSKENPKF